jgi:putative FmdB family regulatory protein
MPIFEYQCRSCGAKFEKVVSSAEAAATCKECGSPRVEKPALAAHAAPRAAACAENRNRLWLVVICRLVFPFDFQL